MNHAGNLQARHQRYVNTVLLRRLSAEGLIAAGERAAEAALPEITAVLERHRSLFLRVPVGAGEARG